MLKVERIDQQIRLSGELDRYTVPAVCPFTELAKQQGPLQLCLAGLSHVDTAGLAWLLEQVEQANKRDVALSLHEVPEQLQRLIDVSGVRTILPIVG